MFSPHTGFDVQGDQILRRLASYEASGVFFSFYDMARKPVVSFRRESYA